MVELKHISKVFQTNDGDFQALKDVNLQIPDGEIYGIIGMSGAGKSTLVRCINMLERPTEGEVFINGQNLCTMNEAQLRAQRRSITMIFQQFNLLMQRTCLKNVCFPMEISGVRKTDAAKRAMELLELVGLPDKANAYPAQLSGGQKQRVAIARAVLTDPKILIMDDSTSAVDMETEYEIQQQLKDVLKGRTTFIIAHRISSVKNADQILVLKDGKIAERGTHAQLLDQRGIYFGMVQDQYRDFLNISGQKAGEA